VQFLKVAMQPGMPQGHGHVGEDKVPIITLPGNPVSSFISFQNFVRPAIARLRGLEAAARPTVRVTIDAAMTSPLNKRQFARGKFVGANVVTPVGAGQGSHVVGGLAASDCLIVIPEGIDTVAAGSLIEVVDLRGDIQ
jgi:molybdopterin molybdotransferase